MSQLEPRRRSTSNRQNEMQLVLNNASSSDLCAQEQLDVGKCGDADLQAPRCDGEGYFYGDRDWCTSSTNEGNDRREKCDSRSDTPDKQSAEIESPPMPSCKLLTPESTLLTEPPKLRRALAYMEFDDGDCDRNEDVETVNESSASPWRLRMYRALKQGIFAKLTKRETLTNQPEEESGSSTLSDIRNMSEADSQMRSNLGEQPVYEHLPQLDLFHQFLPIDGEPLISSRDSISTKTIEPPEAE